MTIKEQSGESPNPPRFNYEAWGYDENGELYHQNFGKWWARSTPWDDLHQHFWCFINDEKDENPSYLSRYEHTCRAIDLMFNWDKEEPGFIWTPEAHIFFTEACEQQYLSVCGAGSSGKSFPSAAWALLNYHASPHNTKVLVTSTSINAARQRIWGAVIKLFNVLPADLKKLSKLVISTNLIKFVDPDPEKADDTTRGIELIAAEPKREANAVAKLIGRKQHRMILIGDELPDLSESINTAAYSNLSRNPYFQYIALGNPASWMDAFGQACYPKKGPSSIDINTYRWETERGIVVRFDDMTSLNYTTVKKWLEDNPDATEAEKKKAMKKKVHFWRPSYFEIEQERRLQGENSLMFMRMSRGFFPLNGASDSIYSNADLLANIVDSVDWGKITPIQIVALDLAFSSGGDRTVMMRFNVGMDATGKRMMEWLETVYLNDDATNEDQTRTAQICEQIRAYVDRHGISYRHVCYDSTGAGGPFGDMLVTYLSRDILPVNFGGRATDRNVSASIRKPSHERYANRCSEIWFSGVEILRGKQFAKIPKDVQAEMSSRSFSIVAGGKIQVQPKRELKAKTGKSPDLADCVHIALDLCRERLHFTSQERGAGILPTRDYFKKLQEYDVVTLSTGGHDWLPSGEY